MAMTMKTIGLLLWAASNLGWADHVFKVCLSGNGESDTNAIRTACRVAHEPSL